MKVLIATDLLISYLQRKDYVDGLDLLFQWLRTLRYKWYMDLSSIAILTQFFHQESFSILNNFSVLKGIPPRTNRVEILFEILKQQINQGESRTNLKSLLPQLEWLDHGDVDFLITENSTLRDLSKIVGIDNRVYSLEGFISKCSSEHRNIDFNKGVFVRVEKMSQLSLNDKFFSTFKEEYAPYYYDWFHKKAQDDVYVSRDKYNRIRALLKLKVEGPNEDYSDIIPMMKPAKRLKISSFKVDYTGQKLGERFLHIIFDEAVKNKVDEIYVTIFNNSPLRKRLINMISQWGFKLLGLKNDKEQVFVRDMRVIDTYDPRKSYPYIMFTNSAYLIPIHHEYAKDLLPSIELEKNHDDIEPYKCSIKKTITLYYHNSQIERGSILLFYRIEKDVKNGGIIAAGIVENVHCNITNEKQFVLWCRKRSALDDEQLISYWKRSDKNIIVVDFLYNYSFGDNIIPFSEIVKCGIDLQGLHHQQPIELTKDQYKSIIRGTNYEKNIDCD